MRKSLYFGLLLLLSIVCVSASAEDISITTYYPAPYGVYRDLEARRNLTVGENFTVGELGTRREPAISSTLIFGDVTISPQEQDGDLGLEAGNVNIGLTTSPATQKLDVDGKIRMRTQTEVTDGSDIVVTREYFDGRRGLLYGLCDETVSAPGGCSMSYLTAAEVAALGTDPETEIRQAWCNHYFDAWGNGKPIQGCASTSSTSCRCECPRGYKKVVLSQYTKSGTARQIVTCYKE